MAVPAKEGTVLALLDARGKIRRGWPVLLKGASDCELDTDLVDGSVRAVCAIGESRTRAFALDAAGRLMPGWPVDLPGGSLLTWMSDPARVVKGALYVLLVQSTDGSQDVSVIHVSPGGDIDAGAWVRGDMHFGCCAAVGPDGAAYVQGDDGIWAIDLDGARPGFPLRIDGWASAPAFGPDGRLYMTVDDPDEADGKPSSHVVAFIADGRAIPGWSVTFPMEAWTWFGDPTAPPLPPVVTANGTVYVTGWSPGTDGVIAFALGPSGARRPGWPYRSGNGILTGRATGVACSCQPCFDPAALADIPPVAGPDQSLLLVQLTGKERRSGNRIVAVRRDGTAKPGWPVTLVETGAWFYAIAVGSAGTVYGYAVEPAGSRKNRCGEKAPVSSGTVVAFDGHGDQVYATTLVVP